MTPMQRSIESDDPCVWYPGRMVSIKENFWDCAFIGCTINRMTTKRGIMRLMQFISVVNIQKKGRIAPEYFNPKINYNLLIISWRPDFRFAALFLWITLRFASLSNIAATLGNNCSASFLSLNVRILRTALRVVLCWYLLRNLFDSFERILFCADLWFAISLLINSLYKNCSP